MSAISEKVRQAIFEKLSVTEVTSLATGGIYESEAPAGTNRPYVIFRRQAPGNVDYAFGAPTPVMENDLWLIKGIADKDCDETKSPQQLAEEISVACEVAIGNNLTLIGNAVVWCARFSDMPPYQEKASDYQIYHRGFLLQVKTV